MPRPKKPAPKRGGPRPGSGRKKLDPADRRSRRIVLLVTPGDGEAIDRAAGGRDDAPAWCARVAIEAAKVTP